ncbi:MAG: hypothetical protein RL015_1041 [Verrucomicrobiota bacterium]|jgi:cupin 2 domain-containing protein
MLILKSLFTVPSDASGSEIVSPLLEKTGLRIESIHSRGQVSPDGFWYDQQEDEWVMLAQGGATLEIETQSPVTMRAGDYLLIPKGIKHRVSESSDDAVWLAIHFS